MLTNSNLDQTNQLIKKLDILNNKLNYIHSPINELKTDLIRNNSDVYSQYELKFHDFKVILTTGKSPTQNNPTQKNKKSAIIFLLGMNTYYFQHHLKTYLPDHDFFVIDLPGRGFNINYNYKGKTIPDSYIDNINDVYYYLKSSLEYLSSNDDFNLNKTNYENIYMFGHSTGGLFASYFVSRYENENKNKFIDRLCLDSPLTDIYSNTQFETNSKKNLIKFLCLFSYKIDLNYNLFQPGLVNLINSLMSEINELKDYKIDLNYLKEMSELPLYSGFAKSIIDAVDYIKENKIKTNVKMVCSRNYLKDEFSVKNYIGDSFIDPDYMIQDIQSFTDNNFKYKQYISGHGCLMKPKEGFISDGLSYTDVADFLFKNQLN